MNIVIAGGTGFLGSALRAHLGRGGHHVQVLTRRPGAGRTDEIAWPADGTLGPWSHALDNADAVINLAGAGLADGRWTPARKELLRASRVRATRSLVLAAQHAAYPPAVLINASGIGYYGDTGGEIVTESTPAGHDFLAQLCVEWEREAEHASDVTRVVIMRNGVVLEPSGGALARMLLPFKLGLGGPLGSGAQYFPWIHLADWLALVDALLGDTRARGAYNVTAPNPATNADFTRALGRALGRPTFIPVPGFGLRAALGELAETLLTGQRAIPKRAEEMGFTFRYRQIEPALAALL